ncbi:hypothetical protein BD1_22 [Octadecabacter Antarctic BD virus 1]|nr:hypothetical protein BD1_22 [Octadecabacter Antarctic BD virus 1]
MSLTPFVLGGLISAPLEHVGSRTYSRRGSSTAITVPLTGLSGGLATAPRAGDTVVVFLGVSSALGDTHAAATPAGWTEIATVSKIADNVFTGSGDNRAVSSLKAVSKVMGASPDTSVVITGGSGDGEHGFAASVAVFSGASPDAVVFATVAEKGKQPRPPSITPTALGSIVLGCGHAANRRDIGAFSSSSYDAFASERANDTYDAAVGLGRFAWIAGAFTPDRFSGSGISNSNAATAITLVIAPK